MKYATRTQYAKLCGVKRQAIDARIKSGSLKTKQIKDVTGNIVTVIDVKKFPPVRSTAGVSLKAS